MITYKAEIDGLRAIAVIAVILFHAGFSFISGGYTGVDVFFVISGFLITSIIIPKIKNNEFRLREFYAKRARRLLPALYTVFLASFVLAWFTLLPSQFIDFAKSMITALLCISNFFFYESAGYWDTATELKPLIHTWSLAVEEQFYFIYPLLLLILYKVFNGRFFIFSTILVVLSSLALSIFLISPQPDFTFYLLPTRAWEMGFGSLAALLNLSPHYSNRLNQLNNLTRQALSLIGFGLILYPLFLYTPETIFPGLSALPSALGTVLVILFANQHTIVGSLLRIRPLVGIGLMSYSLYLWHQPLFSFAKLWWIEHPSLIHNLALITFTFVLAWASWKFIENPARNPAKIGAKKFYPAITAITLLLLLSSAYGIFKDGLPTRKAVTSLEVLDYQPDNKQLRIDSWKSLVEISGSKDYGVKGNPVDHQLWFKPESGKQRKVLLIGNSFSKDLFNVLTHSKYNDLAQFSRYGIRTENLNETLFTLPNYKAADTIIICSRYSKKDLKNLPQLIDRIAEEKKLLLVLPYVAFHEMNGYTVSDLRIIKAVREKGELDSHEVITLASEINKEYTREVREYQYADFEQELQLIFSEKSHHKNVYTVDRLDYMQNDDLIIGITKNLGKCFYDYGHHTTEGAKLYAQYVSKTGWLDVLFSEEHNK